MPAQLTDFTLGGEDISSPDLADSATGSLFETDARDTYSNPDPTARQVGVDTATGNPIWQLIDKGGTVMQWAVDKAGNLLDLKPVGTVAQDARLTYSNPDPSARKVGTDTATGNPIWQLVDAGGQVMQWAVDLMGNVVDLKPVGSAPASATPTPTPVTRTPPSSLVGGDPGASLLDSILTGNGNTSRTSSGGLGITNVTDNRPVTTTNIDASVRTTSNTTTNISTNVNSADLVSKVVDSVASLFRQTGGNAPLQSASAVTPMNDTLFGSPLTPASRQAGMSLDASRMPPGSNASPKPAAAVLSGNLASTVTNENNRPLLLLGLAVSVAALLVVLFRRRA